MLLTQSVNVHHSVQMQTLNSHQTGHTFNLPPPTACLSAESRRRRPVAISSAGVTERLWDDSCSPFDGGIITIRALGAGKTTH